MCVRMLNNREYFSDPFDQTGFSVALGRFKIYMYWNAVHCGDGCARNVFLSVLLL